MTQHPIIPPPQLVQQWVEHFVVEPPCMPEQLYIATRAAQWGSDQELEACCEWIPTLTPWDAEQLRAARRPKPPSLKEQALEQLDSFQGLLDAKGLRADTIRRALEQLPSH